MIYTHSELELKLYKDSPDFVSSIQTYFDIYKLRFLPNIASFRQILSAYYKYFLSRSILDCFS